MGGKGKFGRKRLGENAFKMADQTNDLNICIDSDTEDVRYMLLEMERPIHNAFKSGKVLCPKQLCLGRKEFFEESGIQHHFRVKHNSDFTENDHQYSIRTRRILHEEETKACLEQIFKYRQLKVCNFCSFYGLYTINHELYLKILYHFQVTCHP